MKLLKKTLNKTSVAVPIGNEYVCRKGNDLYIL